MSRPRISRPKAAQGGWRRAWATAWLLAGSWTCLLAQYASVPLIVLDAEGHDLHDDAGRGWDPEDGVWVAEAKSLTTRDDMEVYVTNEVCADSIVAWSLTGTERDRRLVNAFTEEYRQRGWMLHAHDGRYDLREVNDIAEDIYQQYGYLVDYWCAQTDDRRGPYAVALLLHPATTGRYECVRLTERLTQYDGEEPLCPLYYKCRTELDNVEMIYALPATAHSQARARSQGQWLTFDEPLHIAGSAGQRLVVERRVEPCTFAEDRSLLYARLANEGQALRQAHQLLDPSAAPSDSGAWLAPVVVAGRKFLATRRRQLRGDLRRDTLEAYRLPMYLCPEAVDTVMTSSWAMPDAQHYYRLRHTYYLQDFTHADTLQRIACGCERQQPAVWLRLAAQPATFDCPPRLHGATDVTATFRPRTRGELHDARYKVALRFEQGSALLDLTRGQNQQWMDSLVGKAYALTHGDVQRRIEQVTIVGIASPEGQRAANLRLSHQRSLALSERLQQLAGDDLRHARMVIAEDSIAPWTAVAARMEQLHPEAHDEAQRLRAAAAETDGAPVGFDPNDPWLREALDGLREAQVSFVYKEVGETSLAGILSHYRNDSEAQMAHWPAYYPYRLLQPTVLTDSAQSALARCLLAAHADEVRRFCSDRTPSDSYGLVLPMAANVLASEALRQGRPDREILAPFIDARLGRGNVSCYTRLDAETPVKWINLDVVLHNQILMLCAIGTADALDEACELATLLRDTRTLSPAFIERYSPQRLARLTEGLASDWLHDETMVEALRDVHPLNGCVMDLARAYELTGGDVSALAHHPEAQTWLRQCTSRLTALRGETDAAAMHYLRAVTKAWQAQCVTANERRRLMDEAEEELTALFATPATPGYMERLQGDAYLRGLYADGMARRAGMDLYLTAVERYIRQLSNE